MRYLAMSHLFSLANWASSGDILALALKETVLKRTSVPIRAFVKANI